MAAHARRFVLAMSVGLVFFGVPHGAAAGSTDASTAASQPRAVDSDTDPLWMVEVTGAFFVESWDMNLFRERLGGAAVSVYRQLSPRWTIGVEGHLTYVDQDPVKHGMLPAMVAMVRWRGLQIGETSVFVEGGAGPAYATTRVPGNGTQLNVVTNLGTGLSRPLTPRVDMLAGARWMHLSNSGFAGRWRNPDIQALGVYVGWRLR